MGVIFRGKPVLFLQYNPAMEDEACLTNIWSSEKHWGSRNNSIYVEDNIGNIKKKIAGSKGTLTPNGTLFFGKSSTFPRFKLGESGFKRCIKVDKADNVILGDIAGTNVGIMEFFEDEEHIYDVSELRNLSAYRLERAFKTRSNKNSFSMDPIKYVLDHHLFYGANFTPCYKGEITSFTKDYGEDVVNILNGTYKNLVMDNEVDKAVNNTFDTITAEDLQGICDMLDSPDQTTQGLGLKMLFGYNVQDTPLTVRTLLGLRDKLGCLNEWKGVGVQQVLSSIGWKGFGQFPSRLWNILPESKDFSKYSEYDKGLVKHIYIRAAKSYMDEALKNVRNTGIPALFNLNISYDVKEG